MDHQQRELRRAAAQAFAESLNKLEQTLCASETEPSLTPEAPIAPTAERGASIDIEQALADIERFMQEKQS